MNYAEVVGEGSGLFGDPVVNRRFSSKPICVHNSFVPRLSTMIFS
jgi:hypothetical protein